MTIKTGRYRIRNAASGTYFDNSLRHQNRIHGWRNHPESENQQWEVEPASEDRYRLWNVQSGRYAHVDRVQNGTRVGAEVQHTEWSMETHHSNTISIHAGDTPFVIDLDMGRPDDGTSINLRHFRNVPKQLWYFEPVESSQQGQQQQNGEGAEYQELLQAGDYNIRNSYAGSALDLTGGCREDRTLVIGYYVHNGSNQSWHLINCNNGYLLQNVASGSYLGFPLGERPRDGILISGNRNAVEWQITRGKYGYQIHLAENPKLVLDLIDGLADGRPVDCAGVCLWSNKDGKNQFWQICIA